MKDTKEIAISIPEGYEIDKEKSTFEKIVFKKKEQTLPKTWKELERINGFIVEDDTFLKEVGECETEKENRNIFFSKEQAEAAVALAQLSQLREVYRQGWVPAWSETDYKFVIDFKEDIISPKTYYGNNVFLSFQTLEIRDEFLENFRDLIMQAKPLLG